MPEGDYLTQFGFHWGPMNVARLTQIDGRGYVLRVQTDTHDLQIYVSPKGRSIRVYQDHKLLVADKENDPRL